jgi:putative YhdH/YhfP family quinone oxidoreductase
MSLPTTPFKAIWITSEDGRKANPAVVNEITLDDLMPGDVTVKVTHTTVNYKDGLAITASAPIARKFPMIPGVDMAGEVVASDRDDFKVGDEVILNGFGVGEGHMGAYAAYARVSGDWLIHRPSGLSAAQAMAIGTAGYTAMLCVMALDKAGVAPDDGPVLVTGAAGGVGSVAIALLAARGYHVVASTGRPEEEDYLKGLGRGGDRRPERVQRRCAPAVEGALGRRCRCRRLHHARQCAQPDQIWRRSGRLRPRPGRRPAVLRAPVHPACGVPGGRGIGDDADCRAQGGL